MRGGYVTDTPVRSGFDKNIGGTIYIYKTYFPFEIRRSPFMKFSSNMDLL